MIPRYAREQMVSIWSDETKYRIHFEIEAHAADALAELGVIPKEAAAEIWEKGTQRQDSTSSASKRSRRRRGTRPSRSQTHLAELSDPTRASCIRA